MNKLVYLYELDSVRNSDEEIKIAQEALYEEIVVNGNQVVLTFNQLTDSKGFLCAVNNEKTYKEILKLFKMGVLRVSRLEDIRTASQYVQNVIDRCIANDNNSFIFSGLPVMCTEKDLLIMVKKAIMYSDPAILEEYLSSLNEKKSNENQKNDNNIEIENEIIRIKYLIRFVKLILELSAEARANNPFNSNGKGTLIDFLNKVSSLTSEYKFAFLEEEGKKIKNIMLKGIEIINEIKIDFIKNEGEKEAYRLMNYRSNWYNKFKKYPNTEEICMAEAIIDLCYNYSMEERVYGVSKHYLENKDEMFVDDLEHRITSYWKLYKDGIHEFHKNYSKETKEYKNIEIPDWKVATRLVKNRLKTKKYKEYDLYEDGYKKSLNVWKKKLYSSIFERLGIAFLYIFIFCVVQYVVGLFEEKFLNTITNIWTSQIITSVLDIVCFGILSTILSECFHLPDILENIKAIGSGIRDFIKYKLVKRGIAYNLILIKEKMKKVLKKS